MNKPNSYRTQRAPSLQSSGKRRILNPVRLGGYYATIRRRLAYVLFAIYLISPWVEFSGRPLIRMEYHHDRFWFLFRMWHLTDAFFFLFIPLLLVLLLFAATAWKGRVWCGYACPQTVFLDWLIRPIEELIEGDAYRRMNQARKGHTLNSRLRKITKHLIYIFLAFFIGNTFLMYFVAPTEILSWMASSPAEQPKAFMLMFSVSTLFYLDFAWFREQFCSFVCPYARFQAILMDEKTPSVVYDSKRGEPRAKAKNSGGDCIDCGLCVRVCPTGIDIREGNQLECIQCLRCVDACDSVMKSIKKPPRLISYASSESIFHQTKAQKSWLSSLNPRLVLYSTLLTVLLGVFGYRILNRTAIELRFIRQPGQVFVEYADGKIANFFQLHMTNTTGKELLLDYSAEQAQVKIDCGRCDQPLSAFESRKALFVVKVPKEYNQQIITLTYSSNSDKAHTIKLPFIRGN